MLDDLRHLPPAPDAFQFIAPDLAILLVCILGVFVLLFWPYY